MNSLFSGGNRSGVMVLVDVAHGECQDKLQSARIALEVLPVVTSSSEKDHDYPMVTQLVCC
jgi:hypothetical protein